MSRELPPDPPEPIKAPSPPSPGTVTTGPGAGHPDQSPASTLIDYIGTNRSAFTEAALRDAASAAGYTNEAIDESFSRIAAYPGAGPIRARARKIVLLAYVAVFVVLYVAMAANRTLESEVQTFGIADRILAISLGAFLLMSLVSLRERKNDSERLRLGVGGLIAVPVLFLVVITGICVGTGLPFKGVHI